MEQFGRDGKLLVSWFGKVAVRLSKAELRRPMVEEKESRGRRWCSRKDMISQVLDHKTDAICSGEAG
jgi:hypothetical protein